MLLVWRFSPIGRPSFTDSLEDSDVAEISQTFAGPIYVGRYAFIGKYFNRI